MSPLPTYGTRRLSHRSPVHRRRLHYHRGRSGRDILLPVGTEFPDDLGVLEGTEKLSLWGNTMYMLQIPLTSADVEFTDAFSFVVQIKCDVNLCFYFYKYQLIQKDIALVWFILTIW